MINFSDVKHIKTMKLTSQNFNWTKSSLIYLNLIGLVTLTVVTFQKDKELVDLISGIPMMMLVMTSISVIVFPIADAYEFILKKKICKLLGISFEEEFITKYSEKQINDIKDLYTNLSQSGTGDKDIKSEIMSKIQEIKINN